MWLALGAFSPYVSGSSHSITVTLTGAHGLITVDAVRLVEVGPVTQYGYDASGNNTSVTDPNGNTTNYTYDSLNRLFQETDPTVDSTTPVTTYTYNPLGWLTSTTDPMDRTTTYFYDSVGNQIGEVEPGEAGGLLGQYYLPGGDVTSIPDFSTPTPDHTREDSDIDFSPVSANFNGYSDLDSDFAVRWTVQSILLPRELLHMISISPPPMAQNSLSTVKPSSMWAIPMARSTSIKAGIRSRLIILTTPAIPASCSNISTRRQPGSRSRHSLVSDLAIIVRRRQSDAHLDRSAGQRHELRL